MSEGKTCLETICGLSHHSELAHDADPDASIHDIVESLEQRI